MVLSSREFPLWSSLYLELTEDEVRFGKYNGLGAKQTGSSGGLELAGPQLDLWIFLRNQTVWVGRYSYTGLSVQCKTSSIVYTVQ